MRHRKVNYDIYDNIQREIESGQIIRGIWARAISEALGCNEKAKSLYIRYRYIQITEECAVDTGRLRKAAIKSKLISFLKISGAFFFVGLFIFLALWVTWLAYESFTFDRPEAVGYDALGFIFIITASVFGYTAWRIYCTFKNEW